MARDLLALSPSAQTSKNIASEHGIDLVLGGHDHIYWISKGVTQWNGYDINKAIPDATDDRGDVLIVKSGTDYQDISSVVITLVDAPEGSIRKKIIKEIKGIAIVQLMANPVVLIHFIFRREMQHKRQLSGR
jgi:5'-nucleotidase